MAGNVGGNSNHFSNVIEEVETAQRSNRPDTLVNGIAKVLQQSQNQSLTPGQMGQELQQIRPQLIQSLMQQS